jgi:NAD(P)-dependent dehydrogenase (short-subunit alcohol dehydrogenase family)
LIADIPMRRLGQPEEVAKAIYFLCTEQSSYINGAELSIDGGQHVCRTSRVHRHARQVASSGPDRHR